MVCNQVCLAICDFCTDYTVTLKPISLGFTLTPMVLDSITMEARFAGLKYPLGLYMHSYMRHSSVWKEV